MSGESLDLTRKHLDQPSMSLPNPHVLPEHLSFEEDFSCDEVQELGVAEQELVSPLFLSTGPESGEPVLLRQGAS